VSEDGAYQAFIEWLKLSWHLPETEDLLALVKERYSPQQAIFLTNLPLGLTKLEDLAEMKGMDPAELGPELDELSRQGVVYRRVEGDTVLYKLNDAFFTFLRSSFWAGRFDEQTQALAPLTNKYYLNGFFQNWAYVHQQGLRTLPIEKTIAETKQILPYEDVVKVLDSLDYFAVSTCPCKHRKNLDPGASDCKHPDEVCLHFGDLGRYTVENDLGREITREEAHEILRRAAKSGLVHGLSNWLEGVDTLCNCCKCCCMWLEQYHVLNHPMSLSPSNYRIQDDHERCKACGLCVKRCPTEARWLEEFPEANNRFGQVAMHKEERCIGCGVCVYTCRAEALTLVGRETIEDPPKDVGEFVKNHLTDIQAALAGGGAGEPEVS
jgi:ferredoxin